MHLSLCLKKVNRVFVYPMAMLKRSTNHKIISVEKSFRFYIIEIVWTGPCVLSTYSRERSSRVNHEQIDNRKIYRRFDFKPFVVYIFNYIWSLQLFACHSILSLIFHFFPLFTIFWLPSVCLIDWHSESHWQTMVKWDWKRGRERESLNRYILIPVVFSHFLSMAGVDSTLSIMISFAFFRLVSRVLLFFLKWNPFYIRTNKIKIRMKENIILRDVEMYAFKYR